MKMRRDQQRTLRRTKKEWDLGSQVKKASQKGRSDPPLNVAVRKIK